MIIPFVFTFALVTMTPGHAAPNKLLVIIGDSLTVGAGVRPEEAYPSLVRRKIEAAGCAWRLDARGINGSVSASAPARVEEALRDKPDLIMLALGGNDGLRHIPLAEVEQNLGRALALTKAARVKTVLAALRPPAPYDAAFAARVTDMFARLAKAHDAVLLPSMLEGVAGVPGLNQADGIHPTPAGHVIIADRVWAALRPLLD